MIRDWSTFDNWAKKLVGSAKSQHWRLPRGEFEQNYDQILIKNGFALTTTNYCAARTILTGLLQKIQPNWPTVHCEVLSHFQL